MERSARGSAGHWHPAPSVVIEKCARAVYRNRDPRRKVMFQSHARRLLGLALLLVVSLPLAACGGETPTATAIPAAPTNTAAAAAPTNTTAAAAPTNTTVVAAP